MVCDPSSPLKSATRIKARIVLFNIEIPITKGFMVVFHYQSTTEPAVIKKLVSQLNKSTGEVVKSRPKYVFVFFFLVVYGTCKQFFV